MQGDGAPDVLERAPASAAPARAAFVDRSALAALEPDWRDLAAQAVEANPFYSPSLLAPAFDAFAEDRPELAVVRDGGGRLIGLAPLAPLKGYSRLPVLYIATWMHKHCYFAAPLVRKGAEQDVFRALFDLVEKRGAFLRLRHLDADGPLFAAAVAAAAETGRIAAPSARYARALLPGGWRTDAYLATSLTGKKRKELRRQRARLGDEGPVSVEFLTGGPHIDAWAEQFLTLEAAGWKGRERTALAAEPASAAFFRAVVRRSAADGALHFGRLLVNARPAAMAVNFISRFSGGEGGFAFKIAYDETLARFSPGVALEIEMMRDLEPREGLAYVDSCAQAGHPMIDRLWSDRRAIAALNVSRRDAPSKALFTLLMTLERAGERARAAKAGPMEPERDDDL